MSAAKRRSSANDGRLGEEAAATYLLSRGYEVLERRYRRGGAEIDLVARSGAVLIFVEVKLRRSHVSGSPFEAVPASKQARIARAAAIFLAEFPQFADSECRFDLLGVEPCADGSMLIEHLPGAFHAPEGYGA